MNCKNLKKILPDYIDKKLSEKQIEEFQNHIESCSDCSILYQKFNNTFDLLKPKAEIAEHAFYFTRLKQKMENRNSPKESIFISFFSRKLVQPVIYLSSLIIAVYIGILIGSGSVAQEQYSEFNNGNEDYIQTFAEYQYLNDFEIEPIENLLIDNDNIVEE
ncbi:MAG: zf-HC2 domain-containing protein [Bacteroidales bacterium]|nr:zf-HC2 domain-containing protein [Bacteroidales bacterium]